MMRILQKAFFKHTLAETKDENNILIADMILRKDIQVFRFK